MIPFDHSLVCLRCAATAAGLRIALLAALIVGIVLGSLVSSWQHRRRKIRVVPEHDGYGVGV